MNLVFKKYLNIKMKKKGFTLLEVIIAIFIITVGVVGTISLIVQTLSGTAIASQRLIAAYLAQEGIEIIRNIRDTNWLEGGDNPWNEGLTGCSNGCIADYKTPTQLDPPLPAYNGQYLNIDTNGFYSYFGGTPTKFQRKITISSETDVLTVKVSVIWREKGKTHSISLEEKLYNWR